MSPAASTRWDDSPKQASAAKARASTAATRGLRRGRGMGISFLREESRPARAHASRELSCELAQLVEADSYADSVEEERPSRPGASGASGDGEFGDGKLPQQHGAGKAPR